MTTLLLSLTRQRSFWILQVLLGAAAAAVSTTSLLVFVGIPLEIQPEQLYGWLEPVHENLNTVTV